MTSKEIEKLIKKNVIEHIESGLKQKGTYILKHPINDILGGFCFERSARDKDSIYIWWFVQPLFIPETMIHLTFGDRFENNHNQSWTNLNSAKTIKTIIDMINNKKPLIDLLLEPNFFYEYFNKKNNENLRIYEALIYTSIWLGSTNWKQEIEEFIKLTDKFDNSIRWIKKLKDDMISISLSDDPKKILQNNKRSLIELLDI